MSQPFMLASSPCNSPVCMYARIHVRMGCAYVISRQAIQPHLLPSTLFGAYFRALPPLLVIFRQRGAA